MRTPIIQLVVSENYFMLTKIKGLQRMADLYLMNKINMINFVCPVPKSKKTSKD